MKKKQFIINFLSLCLSCLIIFYTMGSVFLSPGFSCSVKASSIVGLPDMENLHVIPESNLSQDQVLSIYSALVSNPNISQVGADPSDLLVFCWKYPSTNQLSIYICSRQYCISCDYARVFSSSNSHAVGAWITTTFSDSYAGLQTMNFTVQSVDLSTNNSFSCIIMNTAYNNVFMQATCYFSMNFIGNPDYSKLFSYVYNYSLPFNPDYIEVPVGFSYDVDDFYTWIINNNKLSQLPAYIVQAKLKSFLEFYKNFGSSNNFFISKIADWFSFVSIPSQSLDNIRSLKSATDKLYQEYLDYRSSTHAYWPGATKLQERDDIDTVTNNNNTTLITDDQSDDIYTKLLRDILRGIISISNNVVQGTADIVNKLDHLNFTVNVANNGGLSSGTDLTPVINKLDDVIEALQADTVSVEIDQTTQDDTDDFFDDWNLVFSTAISNKFPVASQLSFLFTDFFEKCGVDVDGDGEVFEYYSPGVLRSVRSSSSNSEQQIVSDFLSNFDDADPAFLDDASFINVPDLSVTIGGQSVSILDFRVYAKYRDKILFIISFVIWTLYLLHLYKALPSIIGQVADVSIKLTDDD